MLFKKLLPVVAFAAAASAQTLVQALTSQNTTLSTLIGLLGAQPDLVKTLSGLSGITVLAPSNDALTKLLATPAGASLAKDSNAVAALLTYHVLNGTYPSTAFKTTPQFLHSLLTDPVYTNVTGGQVVEGYVNGSTVDLVSGALAVSKVTKADIKFTGGVIHIIDTVLTLPISDSDTATAAGLTSLAGALTTAGLVSTVNGLKDVTIFAPTNAAFAAISSTVSTLTKAQLSSILTYHVVAGTVGYSSLLSNTSLVTVNGASVKVTVTNDAIFINSAKVVIANVIVANGVVHVIDSVLSLPSSSTGSSPTSSNTAIITGAPTATSGSGGSSASGSNATGSAKPSTATVSGAAQSFHISALGMGALLGGAILLLGL